MAQMNHYPQSASAPAAAYGAAPVAPYAPASAAGYRLEGDTLVVQKGTELPDVCLLTGQRTTGSRKRKTLQWAPPWLAVLMVLGPLFYLIGYFVMRKTGDIGFLMSPAARSRRTTAIAVGIGGSLFSLLLVVVGIALESPLLALGGSFLLLVAIIAGAVMAPLFKITKIDDQNIYLKLKPAAAAAFAG